MALVPAVFDRSFEYPELLLLIWEQWLHGLGTMARVIGLVLFSDSFFMPDEKMGLVNCLFHFVEVYQNTVALLFSNITFDIIEDYIPHYVPTIC